MTGLVNENHHPDQNQQPQYVLEKVHKFGLLRLYFVLIQRRLQRPHHTVRVPRSGILYQFPEHRRSIAAASLAFATKFLPQRGRSTEKQFSFARTPLPPLRRRRSACRWRSLRFPGSGKPISTEGTSRNPEDRTPIAGPAASPFWPPARPGAPGR